MKCFQTMGQQKIKQKLPIYTLNDYSVQKDR